MIARGGRGSQGNAVWAVKGEGVPSGGNPRGTRSFPLQATFPLEGILLPSPGWCPSFFAIAGLPPSSSSTPLSALAAGGPGQVHSRRMAVEAGGVSLMMCFAVVGVLRRLGSVGAPRPAGDPDGASPAWAAGRGAHRGRRFLRRDAAPTLVLAGATERRQRPPPEPRRRERQPQVPGPAGMQRSGGGPRGLAARTRFLFAPDPIPPRGLHPAEPAMAGRSDGHQSSRQGGACGGRCFIARAA